MKAVRLENKQLVLCNVPKPTPPEGWALLRVKMAGICSTDLELVKGYMGFEGTLGHEFVAVVEDCSNEQLRGKRVVGEINAACGTCEACKNELGRHCPNRSVLGILNHDGCLAEYCILPEENLLVVPDSMPDETAVFTEPVSAAYEILDQLNPDDYNACLVLGDGKLGILCAWVMANHIKDTTLAGHHPEKLARASRRNLATLHTDKLDARKWDLVIDCTGHGSGIQMAMACCRPRGTLVLKSTVASQGNINLAPIVIDEITVIGSRCGRFAAGLPALQSPGYPVSDLVDGVFPLDCAEEAFKRAAERGVLKILVGM